MGGPSDRQFELKPGIHVTPSVDYSRFDPDSELGRRRSIYRFLFRTLPDPFMESLDCPSGDQITPVRGSNVTIQQALALWNDVFVTRHCEHIAARLDAEAGSQEQASASSRELHKLETAVRLILCRSIRPDERELYEAYVSKHGLANFCRLLLNSNEFLYLN